MKKENKEVKHLAKLKLARKLALLGIVILAFYLLFYFAFVETTKAYPDWTRDISTIIGLVGLVLLLRALFLVLYEWIFY